MSQAVQIYSFPLSGHSHRVQLFASVIGINHELVPVDLANGEHKKAPYLTINPFGQVPALKDGGIVIADSNAILVYLARKYAPDWISSDPVTEAEIQRFLSLAAGSIAYGPAAARLITVFGADLDIEKTEIIAYDALDKLEGHLDGKTWLVAERPSIADIAIYSYVAHAPEGNISLEGYPNIRSLLTRIEMLPGFIPMPASKAGLAA